MPDDPQLSVVVPIFNEVASLDALHRELDASLAGIAGGIEILFVDDGSDDGGRERMGEIARRDPRVRVLVLDRNHGQSTAFEAGFRAARGEVVATLDGDLQHDPADIPPMLALLDRADVVNGVRVPRADSRLRRLVSRIANGFRSRLTGDGVSDVGCSLRVMRRSQVEGLTLYRGMHRFLPTLLWMEGARIVEVPVRHRRRRHGRSKYGNLERLAAGIVDLGAVCWMQSRRERYRVEELARPGG